jgi:hypothetical protein
MPRITISYRRDDSGVITGRIFDRLVARYGSDAVFRDIDNIPIGVDYRREIDRTLGASDVALAIVGPHWLGSRRAENRIANEGDPVRVEIEAALRNHVPIIPVLVLGAAMPRPADLPEGLHDFTYLNAVEIDAAHDFDVHMGRLIRAVDRILSVSGGAENPAKPLGKTARVQRYRYMGIALGAVVLLAAGLIAGVWYAGTGQQSASTPNATANATAPVAPLAANPASSTPNTTTPPNADKSAAAAQPIDAELLFWQSVERSNSAADFQEYLRQYPQGRFAGLARNRLAALSAERQNAKAEPKNPAASPPASAPCSGNSDEQILHPIRLTYEAIRTKNIDLFAAQASEDAVYRRKLTGAVRGKAEEIKSWRETFATWQTVELSIEEPRVVERTADRAVVEVAYAIQVRNRGVPTPPPSRGNERYDVLCDSNGRWLVRQNVYEPQ